ncbi:MULTISPECIES: hypothetical protein [unclassified Butyricimonas]|uniref:hypothetical protein n=1 Tax=unclassified Butyricimonas TaxID=2637652 RepID=UPI00159BD7FC|nr:MULTISPECIES: hypothetical protein [unclassified Butyricimonas]
MRTIQKLLRRGRRDSGNKFLTAFYSWGAQEVEIVLKGKSIEARHQLAFLLA